MLTGNSIFFSAIANKLKDQDIVKIIMIFNIEENRYDVMLRNSSDKKMNINITDNEISLLKKLFINKIIDAYYKRHKDKIIKVIIQVDVVKKCFEVFTENEKNKVTKFDY